MAAFDDAEALVAHAESELPAIRKAYEESLHAKTISTKLLIEIKNVFENLRSALDFAAQGLYDRHCKHASTRPKIYFPYANASQSKQEFENNGRINACVPGLAASRPDVVTALLDIQHFSPAGHGWLPKFMEMNNENKHQRLVPQERRETKEMRISNGGATISVGAGASISVGHGASISIGGATIHGGQTFDVNNPPRMQGGKIEVITWVSFHFETTGEAVVPFLEAAVNGAKDIVGRLKGL